ncbi:serine hydrolase [Paucibacter sp. APW11]|uniref:Serine hydrolase n=1 Tax=Roseateles aquae TaxID=3077235 RepID=A0ABU3PDS0_9BURK|nr:serine hydrolase [Paucibacter sp. APW11]MDT9000693.1 serine hydrolase [Paucibacter sp. APW11]
MGTALRLGVAGLICCLPLALAAAPDELRLGRDQGYPAGNASNWFFSESLRVGSFSHQGEIAGVLNGRVHELPASNQPMPLRRAAQEPALRWSSEPGPLLSIDDYLARHRVMGLMIVKDGEVLVERYQYERGPQHRFVSHSMAKSIVSLGIGLALREGRLGTLDDKAERYAPRLKGSLYGDTSLRNLLRMSSGARFEERYDGQDDLNRFAAIAARDGLEKAAGAVTERSAPQGTRFNYSSAETTMLAAALRGASGQSLADYLGPRLWQAMGAEQSALWHTDLTGLETAAGNFNATLRDYARLGVLLANDGARPDTGQQVLPRDYLIEATDWHRHAMPFQPGKASSYYGYGYQFWTFPGTRRRFALMGVFGQLMYVDPANKLVMVQAAADATPQAGASGLARDADALWRALVTSYGPW